MDWLYKYSFIHGKSAIQKDFPNAGREWRGPRCVPVACVPWTAEAHRRLTTMLRGRQAA
jgi:hypothetical protein